jgi:hypothetical protein
MLATYNIDPIKLLLDNKKNKIKNFITFPNVASHATLANTNVAWHATLANTNVAWHATLAYGFEIFFPLQFHALFHYIIYIY